MSIPSFREFLNEQTTKQIVNEAKLRDNKVVLQGLLKDSKFVANDDYVIVVDSVDVSHSYIECVIILSNDDETKPTYRLEIEGDYSYYDEGELDSNYDVKKVMKVVGDKTTKVTMKEVNKIINVNEFTTHLESFTREILINNDE